MEAEARTATVHSFSGSRPQLCQSHIRSNRFQTTQWEVTENITRQTLKADCIKEAVKYQFQKESNEQCQLLRVRTFGEPSVLKDLSVEALEIVKCSKIMTLSPFQCVKDRHWRLMRQRRGHFQLVLFLTFLYNVISRWSAKTAVSTLSSGCL